MMSLQAILLSAPVKISREMISRVVDASNQLFCAVTIVLKDSNLPGRNHYMFSLSDLVSLFQVTHTHARMHARCMLKLCMCLCQLTCFIYFVLIIK